MTLNKRLQVGASVLVCAAAMAFGAAAQAAPQALSTTDAQRYAAAFDACDRGDFIDAEMQTVEIKDKSLLGYVTFQQLMHPTAHKASFDELSGWLAKFRDLPLADRIFQLAAKRKPADAGALPTPMIAVAELAPGGSPERARQAREAFYAGDSKRALELAPAAGERWIAGLAAYRLKAYEQAQTWFGQLARDGSQDAWLRSAAAFWGSRAATALGDNVTAAGQLRLAAQNADTFYGMIAERQLRLQTPREAEAQPQFIRAAYVQPSPEVARLIEGDPRAHRAAALAQIGRLQEAGEELRAGLSQARTPADRSRWTALAAQLGGVGGGGAIRAQRTDSPDDYPLPPLAPKSGFTIDRALVYAIVRQESRFNPMAVSHVGAVGLMQLMPEAAARAAGDDKLKADMSPLFDPAFNLRVGQDYVTWLMERGVGYDLLRTVAAYNGGPNTILKTAQMLGDDADSLLLIESLPSQETRNYVEKVVAGYWTYKKMFGEETPTLDAVAGGRFVDARLDLTQPTGAGTQLSAQPLQVGMR
jgi:soluble lytic murein transglycosylase-like protein